MWEMELGCRTALIVSISVFDVFDMDETVLEANRGFLLVSTSAWYVGARKSEMCRTPDLPPESRTG